MDRVPLANGQTDEMTGHGGEVKGCCANLRAIVRAHPWKFVIGLTAFLALVSVVIVVTAMEMERDAGPFHPSTTTPTPSPSTTNGTTPRTSTTTSPTTTMPPTTRTTTSTTTPEPTTTTEPTTTLPWTTTTVSPAEACNGFCVGNGMCGSRAGSDQCKCTFSWTQGPHCVLASSSGRRFQHRAL